MDSLQIHFLTAYPASCLVRGVDNRPKMVSYGGVDRARISSAALKRAVRVSEAFSTSMAGHLGIRAQRVGTAVLERLLADGIPTEKATAAARQVSAAFGKVAVEGTENEQLCFASNEEIAAAVGLAAKLVDANKAEVAKLEGDITDLINVTTRAVDIALFGRMFAAASEKRMIAAAEVAHPFTVDRASLETDFYVAVDDLKPREDDAGAGFIGEQYFTSGLFYGYARIDMDQLTRNLGSDRELAGRAAKSFVHGLLTVSPSGKKAAFGTHARASWAMIERGAAAPRSLAAAFLHPVKGDDHIAEAVARAEGLAEGLDKAYGDTWIRSVMDVSKGQGSLAELLATALPEPVAA
jgi:CRISPR system Cascade subunit CasC